MPEKVSEKKHICEYCQNNFSSYSSLWSHKKKAKYCLLQRNIIMVCKKCGIACSSSSFFKDHIPACQGKEEYQVINHINTLKNKNEPIYKEEVKVIEKIVEKEVEVEKIIEKEVEVEKVVEKCLSCIQLPEIKEEIKVIEKIVEKEVEKCLSCQQALKIKEEIKIIEKIVEVEKCLSCQNKNDNIKDETKDISVIKEEDKIPDVITDDYLAEKNPDKINFNLFDSPEEVKIKEPYVFYTETRDRFYVDEDPYPLFPSELSKENKEKRDKYILAKVKYKAKKEFENDYNLEQLKIAMDKKIQEIKRFTKKTLQIEIMDVCRELSILRFQTLRFLSPKQYQDILDNHFGVINRVMRDISNDSHARNYELWLNMIEIHLFYPHHYLSSDMYDHDFYKEQRRYIMSALETRDNDSKELIPFSIDKTFRYFNSPLILLLPLEELLKIFLINRYGNNNLIFVPNHKNHYTVKDKVMTELFSFYSLKEIRDGKRYWESEDWLFTITSRIFPIFLDYYIDQFRDIYFQSFGINHFTEKAYSQFKILIGNTVRSIIMISCKYVFMRICQKIISGWATYTPNENDIFDSFCPEETLKKKYYEVKSTAGASNKEEKAYWMEKVSRLFDDIEPEDIERIQRECKIDRSALIKPY